MSLTLLEYKRWPHGAMLRLTNGTATAIRYPVEVLDGAPPRFLVKAPDGKVRSNDGVFSHRDLKPGKSIDFFVLLEPDSPPVRAGITCQIPQTRLELQLQPWVFRLKRWVGIRSTHPPGEKEVWCRNPLSITSSLRSPAGT